MNTYIIAGGDMRFTALASYLARKGGRIYMLGFDRNTLDETAVPSNITLLRDISALEERADYLILPLPVSNDGTTLNTPYFSGTIPLKSLCSAVSEDGIVFGGRLSPETESIFTSRGLGIIDYSKREEFAVMNAVTTAEGAIQLALEEQPIALSGEKCVILGMGRIAKALIHLLEGFGMDITAAARKCSDRAWSEIYGCNEVDIARIADSGVLENADIIFNTVPAPILGRKELSRLKKDCLIIDLASKPGGVDFDFAANLGLRVIWALSLPGKTAPISAGITIGKTIENILHEHS